MILCFTVLAHGLQPNKRTVDFHTQEHQVELSQNARPVDAADGVCK